MPVALFLRRSCSHTHIHHIYWLLKMFLLQKDWNERLSLWGNLVWKEAYKWDINISVHLWNTSSLECFLSKLLKGTWLLPNRSLSYYPLYFWRKNSELATKARPYCGGCVLIDKAKTWPTVPFGRNFLEWARRCFFTSYLHHQEQKNL